MNQPGSLNCVWPFKRLVAFCGSDERSLLLFCQQEAVLSRLENDFTLNRSRPSGLRAGGGVNPELVASNSGSLSHLGTIWSRGARYLERVSSLDFGGCICTVSHKALPKTLSFSLSSGITNETVFPFENEVL